MTRGQTGELHLSSPAFIRSYLNSENSENLYAEQVTEDGETTTRYWLKTGDMGIMDPDGWVFVMARKKEVIKRLGLKIIPSALESCLNAFLESQVSHSFPSPTRFNQIISFPLSGSGFAMNSCSISTELNIMEAKLQQIEVWNID